MTACLISPSCQGALWKGRAEEGLRGRVRELLAESCWVPLLLASPFSRRVRALPAACAALPVFLLSSKLGRGFCSICPASFHRLCFSCKARVRDFC